MRRRQVEAAAVEWALDEVEAQLREEPAHRLNDDQREYSWLLTAPNEVGVHVEAVRATAFEAATVEFDLLAGATGLLPGHARAERRLLLPLTGHTAREPKLLYLVFETADHVYAFETLEEAGDSLEAVDLPNYVGAFSDRGEVIAMSTGHLWIKFAPSGTFDRATLQTLIRGSARLGELAADPHRFALAVWYAT